MSQGTEKGILSVDVRFAPFASAVRRAPKDSEGPALGSAIHAALLPAVILESVPKSSVDVHVYVIEADGPSSLLAAAITASSAALAHARIELRGLITASCAVRLFYLHQQSHTSPITHGMY